MGAMNEKIRELRVEGITKRFPGIVACDSVDLAVGENEILALVGENGAGKTTLMNILMGLYQPDEGRIFINGRPVQFKAPSDAFAAGIGMVHQHFMLVPNMTVAENVALGLKESHKYLRLDLSGVKKRIAEVSERYNLPVQPDAYIWQLSVGEQQRVELIKTLCFGARFLILDEPTSALTPQETDELIVLLRRMASDMSIIFISHKLAEVTALSDRVAILRRGSEFKETRRGRRGRLSPLMTGHEVVLPRNRASMALRRASVVRDLSQIRRGFLAPTAWLFDRSGEILGLAGVSGNGQKELADALAGLRKVEAGGFRSWAGSCQPESPRDNRCGARLHSRGPQQRGNRVVLLCQRESDLEGFRVFRIFARSVHKIPRRRTECGFASGTVRYPVFIIEQRHRLSFGRKHPESHPGTGTRQGTESPDRRLSNPRSGHGSRGVHPYTPS